MSIQTLSSVTIETIENYRHAATAAVKAYRAGSQRLIDAVNAGLEKNVAARTEEYAPNLTLTLNQFRDNVTEVIVKGVDGVTSNTTKASGSRHLTGDAAFAGVATVTITRRATGDQSTRGSRRPGGFPAWSCRYR